MLHLNKDSLIILIYPVYFLIIYTINVSKIDPDFGWHLRQGNQILQQGKLDYFDTYTYFASDFHPTTHEWLQDIITALIYNFGGVNLGYNLLAGFYSLLICLSIYILCKSKNILLSAALLASFAPFLGIRPIVYSILFFSIIIALYRTTKISERKKCILIILVIWIWSNFHGSFLLGAVYLIFNSIVKPSKFVLFGTVGGLLIANINPYGFDLYKEVFSTMSDHDIGNYIAEWKTNDIDLVSLGGILIIWAVSIWQTLPTFSHLKTALNRIIRLDNVLLYASYKAVRQSPLFAITVIDYVTNQQEVFLSKILKQIVMTFIIATLFFYVLFVPTAGYISAFSTEKSVLSYNYPIKISEYLNEKGCEGNLFHHYSQGGFFEWKNPELKAFFDGRGPSWKRPSDSPIVAEGLGESGEKYMLKYATITKTADAKERDNFINDWNIKCVVWPVDSSDQDSFYQYLIDNDGIKWTRVMQEPNEKYTLFTRK